ncbi:hypothetical protein I7I48_11050 [Histoplasma ohiense]|nr:hypothetical protein I7I48_11050 [Histoplasma ohiense (nom. inval.)]
MAKKHGPRMNGFSCAVAAASKKLTNLTQTLMIRVSGTTKSDRSEVSISYINIHPPQLSFEFKSQTRSSQSRSVVIASSFVSFCPSSLPPLVARELQKIAGWCVRARRPASAGLREEQPPSPKDLTEKGKSP